MQSSLKSLNTLHIGIFTSASSKLDVHYLNIAKLIGATIAGLGHRIVYGGAKIGMMGAVADGALEHGGQVIGVFPENLGHREISHPNLSEIIYTKGLHQRKEIMYQKSDFFISLPGGFGTLDESFEVLTWNQLGHIQKPLYFYNHHNFYDELILFLTKLEKEKFTKVYDQIGIRSINNIDQLLHTIENEIKRKYES